MSQNEIATSVQFSLPAPILHLIDELERSGEEAYLVGGSLRDLLLGIPPHDFDLATSALPEKTANVFSNYRVIATGIKHGTVTVLTDGEPVEITTFRIDGAYTDSRHPDEVIFTNRIVEDLARRDFTVNAMAYHPQRGLIDPFGGQADLCQKKLRAVGDAKQRFSEDSLRILRAFRFSAQLGLDIDEKTLQGAKDSKFGLTNIAKERVASEFVRLLTSDFPARALQLMIEAEILPFVVGAYRPSEAVLSHLNEMPPDDIARLGLFFSDINRESAQKVLRALKLSNKQITGACAIIGGSRMPICSPADARRFIAASGAYALLAVRASVVLGINSPKAIEWVEQNEAPCTIADLAISGRDLLSLGLEPKTIGSLLENLLSRVLEEPQLNKKEKLLALASTWKNKSVSKD